MALAEPEVTKIKEYDATDMVETKLGIYSDDVVMTKYPNPIDGLKEIHRRIIYVLGTQDKKDAMTALIGDVSKLHTGGDSSIYEAVVRLGQPFSIGEPLLTLLGNGGSYQGDSAAAARYLELHSSEFARDIFFNGIPQAVLPMKPSKDFRRLEPQYFIPKIPTALFLANLSIGIGYKSVTPQRNVGDICDLVKAMIDWRKSSGVTIMRAKDAAKFLMPDFPNDNFIVNAAELRKEYSTGRFDAPIHVSGVFELSQRQNRIKLVNTPYGTVPTLAAERLIATMKTDKKGWVNAATRDIHIGSGDSEHCDIALEFKQNVDIFTHLANMKALVGLTAVITPQYYFVYNGRITPMGPTELLYRWYDERYKSVVAGIKEKQRALILKMQELRAFKIIARDVDKVINIIRHSENEREAIAQLTTDFSDLTKAQSRMVYNIPIGRLNRESRTNIDAVMEKTIQEIGVLVQSYGRIDDTIYRDAEYLGTKYRRPRKAKPLDTTIGYVHINKTGVIQFFTEDELLNILSEFRNVKQIDVVFWNKATPKRFVLNGNRVLPQKEGHAIPKEFTATRIIETPAENVNTMVLKDGGASVVKGFTSTDDKDADIFFVSSRFYTVSVTGVIALQTTNDFSVRKSICRGAKTDIIHVMPRQFKDVVIIHMNPEMPNELRLDRVLKAPDDLGCLRLIPTGVTKIISVIPINSPVWYVGLDAECVQKVANHIIRISNIKSMFTDTDHVVIDLLKTKSSPFNRYMKKHPVHPFITDWKLPKLT